MDFLIGKMQHHQYLEILKPLAEKILKRCDKYFEKFTINQSMYFDCCSDFTAINMLS